MKRAVEAEIALSFLKGGDSRKPVGSTLSVEIDGIRIDLDLDEHQIVSLLSGSVLTHVAATAWTA